MRKISVATAAVAAAVLALACPVRPGEGWRSAEGERRWSFPRDHGAHRDYRTEWWYFTGRLSTSDGRKFGYQLTFFRFGVRIDDGVEENPWALRDLYPAHFAVTDLGAGRFGYAERLSREGPRLAWSREEGLGVRILDWSAEEEGGEFLLQAREGEMEIRLRLRPGAEPLMHGRQGLSRKGGLPGQSSFYYSMTELHGRGEIRTPWTEASLPVEGWSWFDHEFGSNQLGDDQAGWDWFSFRLDDGRRVMLYLLRRRDCGVEPFSSGTLREPDGTARHLSLGEFKVEATGSWRSPESGALYPSGWRVEVPSAGIELTAAPEVEGQELETSRSTGVTYWEGAVSGGGMSGGRNVKAEGYVELTGYAGSLGGLF